MSASPCAHLSLGDGACSAFQSTPGTGLVVRRWSRGQRRACQLRDRV